MIKTILKIEGMTCGMCEAHINDCIRRNFEITKIKTSHFKRQAEVLSEAELNEELLSKIIKETGYELISIQAEPFVKKGLFAR